MTKRQFILVILLAVVIGLLVGLVDTLFGTVLLKIGDVRDEHINSLLPFLPLAGLVIIYLYQKWGQKANKGMTLLFEVGYGEEKQIPLRAIPLVTVSTWLTHLFGGSAGREGVAVQLGATISHYFSRWFKGEHFSQLFLTMGMGAGFAGLFQTPLAATFFALEVLVTGRLYLSAVFPVVVAAFTASTISHQLGLEKFSVSVAAFDSFNFRLLVLLLLSGLVFGLVGNFFAFTLQRLKSYVSGLVNNPYYRIVLGSILLSGLLWLLFKGRYSGLGTNLIAESFSGQPLSSYDWLLKLLFTILTISIGFQGGEVTPLFSIGASLGVVIAPLFGFPSDLMAALGYVSVFAAATNTFVAPLLIGGEVFGFEHLPYFFWTIMIAYLLNLRLSIYQKQKNISDISQKARQVSVFLLN